ncbi:MAG: PQQ-dependent sugar dehydrogenase [Burkholderiaceae bacterium]|nr:PQQ-dependent sugar dehydrogenase [Burkholderiaceae bacterium]
MRHAFLARLLPVLLTALATAGAVTSAAAQISSQPAATAPATCGAFKPLAAQTLAGWCAGIVATREQGLRMPRTVLWMGHNGSIDELLVVDMGGWEAGRGRLLQMTVNTQAGTVAAKELLAGLDRPHGLHKGPDGQVWIAEASKISRFTWASGAKPVLQAMVDGLPAEGRHPLKEFAFGPDKAMYINAGAPSDRCSKKSSTGADGKPACTEMAGAKPQAVVYIARFAWPAATLQSLEPFATGLRNSMGLVVHASGTVLQAENNIDLPDEDQPAEEINKLQAGGHYGWPLCVGNKQPLPGSTATPCAQTIAPVMLMPAHAAPLHMQYSDTDFGAGKGKAGLLLSWHGYRAAGSRLVRYATQADGTPTGAPQELIHHWQVADGKDVQSGAPVGWAEDSQGQLWIADDRNRMIVLLQPKREKR